MSLNYCSSWNNDNNQQQCTEDIEEIGYFAALNLNYNCASSEIKKNYEEIFRQLQNTSSSLSENEAEQNENFLTDKLDLQTKRKLMRRMVDACKVLENENLRKRYLEEIKIRCYLSQVVSLEHLIDIYCCRIFPFFIFELHKKTHGIFQDSSHRFFHINFIEMIMEERKDECLIRAFNFTSIKQAVAGFKADEFYLTTIDGREVETFHYQVKYAKQRDLLVELITFAKKIADKKSGISIEKMKNPCYEGVDLDKSTEKIMQNVIGAQLTKIPNSKSLKLLTNDRISPPKQLFSCEVYAKSNNFLSTQKKMWFHLGTSQILLSTDKTANHIIQIFPVDKEYLSFLKTFDIGSFTITCQDVKYHFRAVNRNDVDIILELINQIFKGKVQNSQIIYSLPYNKKDFNVMKMLSKKLKDINSKINETKTYLRRLKREKSAIQELFVKEREKTRVDPDLSKDTSYSKISSYLKPAYQKDGTSLGRIGSLTLTTPPRSPRSKTIIEDQSNTPVGGHTEENYSSSQKQYSKSLTFSERVMGMVAQNSPKIREENASPDFKRQSHFEEARLRTLERVDEHSDINDSLSEEINRQMRTEKKSQFVDMVPSYDEEIRRRTKEKTIVDMNEERFLQYKNSANNPTQRFEEQSPSFCRTGWSDRESQNNTYQKALFSSIRPKK